MKIEAKKLLLKTFLLVLSILSFLSAEAFATSTWLTVKAEPISGSNESGLNGRVTIKAPSQGVSISISSFKNDTKCWFDIATDTSSLGEASGILSVDADFLPTETQTEIPLSYDPAQQVLTGTFTVNAPGSYRVWAELTNEQTNALGSTLVQFHLGDSTATLTPSVTPTPISPPPPFAEWVLSILGQVFQSADAEDIPLILLLGIFIICFVVLFYMNFIKRIPGSFGIRCKCGAITTPIIDMKSPHGRSISLYKLLNRMLRQHEDDDANVIKGIVNSNDNKKNLSEIRIYIVKEPDKQLHYAFRQAGTTVIIDNTSKTVYPNSGNQNANLTVHLSFIKQQSSIGMKK